VAAGRVRIFIPTADDQIDAAIVRPGEMFGEGAILDGGPRLASATTLEPTTLLVIRREPWLALIDRDDVLARRVLVAVGASFRRYVRHTVEHLFLDVDIPDYPLAGDGPGP
jgi:CRP/FNR family transcriptional regulator/CRP/FNR family cyclic AMP-dependent transcriptional regulator